MLRQVALATTLTRPSESIVVSAESNSANRMLPMIRPRMSAFTQLLQAISSATALRDQSASRLRKIAARVFGSRKDFGGRK